MGLTDVLFGRKKLKEAKGERLFAISTARVTLEVELGLKPARRLTIASWGTSWMIVPTGYVPPAADRATASAPASSTSAWRAPRR